jgi:hypothetical protein
MPDIHLEECIASLQCSYRDITKGIDDLRSETHRGFDGVRAEMIRLNDRMETMFRWTMSLILINWLSLLAGIFLVALKK